MNQHFMEIFGSVLVALITALFGPIAILWIKRKLTKSKDEIEIEIFSTEKITTEMEEVLTKLDGDRVWITQFHNGGHFLHSNKSMQKFSVVYEVDAAGVLPVSTVFTNIPISLYSKCFSEILSTRFIGISDYEDKTVATYGLKPGAEATGAKATYIVGLFDFGTGKLMGSVGIDFLEPKKLTDSQIEYFKIRSERVAGYLSSNRQN
jgi:hypothetical protein